VASPQAPLTLRVRWSHRVSALRQLAVIVPSVLVGVGLSIALFAITGNLGAGIAALFVLGVGGLVAAGFAAQRLDRKLDGKGEPIQVTAHQIRIPGPEPRVIPRAGLYARAGWYSRRFRAQARGRGEDNSRGLFVHLKWPGGQILLEATDGVGKAGPLGVKRFTAPPGDMPHYWVWSDELSPLIPELGANH